MWNGAFKVKEYPIEFNEEQVFELDPRDTNWEILEVRRVACKMEQQTAKKTSTQDTDIELSKDSAQPRQTDLRHCMVWVLLVTSCWVLGHFLHAHSSSRVHNVSSVNDSQMGDGSLEFAWKDLHSIDFPLDAMHRITTARGRGLRIAHTHSPAGLLSCFTWPGIRMRANKEYFGGFMTAAHSH